MYSRDEIEAIVREQCEARDKYRSKNNETYNEVKNIFDEFFEKVFMPYVKDTNPPLHRITIYIRGIYDINLKAEYLDDSSKEMNLCTLKYSKLFDDLFNFYCFLDIFHESIYSDYFIVYGEWYGKGRKKLDYKSNIKGLSELQFYIKPQKK